MVKKTIFLLFIFILFQALLATSDGGNISSNQRYISGEDGKIRMYVNIWGHVNQPGRILVEEGVDFPTLISLVGGPKQGANLGKIYLYREMVDSNNNNSYTLDLNHFMNTGDRSNFVKVKPNDTYVIKQTFSSYLFDKISIVNTIMSTINLYLTISK